MMRLFDLFKQHYPKKIEIEKGLEILGLGDIQEDKEYLLNEISLYLLDNSQISNGKKIFDYNQDFKYYYVDFLEMGINLNKDDISWWEFNSILDGIFLKKHSVIGQVLQYRTYEKPSKNTKNAEEKEHQFNLQKKRQYALEGEDNKKETQQNIRLMMNRAKEINKN